MDIQWTWKKIMDEKYRSVEKIYKIKILQVDQNVEQERKHRDIRD